MTSGDMNIMNLSFAHRVLLVIIFLKSDFLGVEPQSKKNCFFSLQE